MEKGAVVQVLAPFHKKQGTATGFLPERKCQLVYLWYFPEWQQMNCPAEDKSVLVYLD